MASVPLIHRSVLTPAIGMLDQLGAPTAGASYEIELWRGLSISPEINADLVDGETTLVFGASLGWGF